MNKLKEISQWAIDKRLKNNEFNDFELFNALNDKIKNYTEECVKASLEKAYFNHEIFTRNGHDEEIIELDKDSITDPKNIILL